MRTILLAGPVCLLAAATAAGQSPSGAILPPMAAAQTGQLPTLAPPPEIAEAVATDPWAMNGPRVWGSVDYLLWWVRPMKTPDLIQQVPSAQAQTNTTLAPGAAQPFFPPPGQGINFGAFSGLRGTVGVNFDRFGLEASGFVLFQKTKNASLFSNGTPFAVAESYVSAGNGQPITLFASLPNQYSGGVQVSSDSRLWGLEGNTRLPFFTFLTSNTDALVGFRYVDLQENLNVGFHAAFPTGRVFDIQDAIHTRNQFYGGQIGMNGRIGGQEKGFGLDMTSKIALGDMRQRAELVGSNTITDPGVAPSVEQGGLYARGANLGVFDRDKVAMVFDLNLNMTYNFNCWSQVYVGYSFLYLSSVIRPGTTIDPVINDSQTRFVANPTASTANRPVFDWRTTDFWAQGITFGLKLQY
ncbi:MAG: hypothetical protein JWO38_1403 [Gemmataceae bacterium]|nr:hypothetical protein [Gemmataceae bacterium]